MIVIGLSAAAGQQPGPAGSDSRTGLIVGQVLDGGSGRPVGGALIEIVAAPFASGAGGSATTPSLPAAFLPSVLPRGPFDAEWFPAMLTGSDGRFVIRRLPAARYTITAAKPGYLAGAYGRRRPGGASQVLLLGDGQKSGAVRIFMWRPASISGVVIDEAGEPVVGIQIRAMRRGIVAGQRRFAYTGAPGWTDDRGMYRIAGLTPGDYLVAAVSTQVSVPASTALEMRQGGGSSMAIGEIGASAAGGASSIRVADSILTLGRSAIGPAPSSDAHVYVYPTTFHPNTSNPVRAAVLTVGSGDEREGIDLHIRPVATRRVSGVLGGADSQVGGIAIRVVPEDVEDSPIDLEVASTVTSRTGTFTFPALPVGHYLFQAIRGLPVASTTTVHTGSGGSFSAIGTPGTRTPFGYGLTSIWWASVPLAVGRDDIDNLSLRLLPGLRVTGRAEFEGTRQKPAGVRLMQVPVVVEPASETSRVPATPGRFDSAGQLTAYGLPAGKYVLRIGAPPQGWYVKSAVYNGRDVSDAPLELEADALGVIVTFTDRLTEISGTVRKATGSGDGDATVLVFPSDTQAWTTWNMNSKRFRSARVTPAGGFQIGPIPPGDYYVVAVPEEQSADWQDASMLDAISRVAAPLTLSEGDKKTLDLRTREIR
ncbi:MAG: hypothetical protein A3H96_13115 [Acidobacteria bacterium RIFCSPLOWO2_02_FULL_67_36]|nr:MAG: hypothetical protein A3H96_13115 [Acidobacteria bacterium RIFCSPLOWO2_02_FULL_67_36]OFW23558.1 MAG: hypothetical protein A3G21_06420 [Acidobacteria bacterium RIFCSPLOWO2_12_FULL_66_21]